jgi:hypothetical protein
MAGRTTSICAALVATLGTLAVTSPASAATFGLGDGTGPGVALDARGTAYIAWNGPDSGATLNFCKLPRGASACAPRSTISAPGTADGRAFVFVSMSRVVVVSSRFAGGGRGTFSFTSSNGGKTFGSGELIGDVAFKDAVTGPGNTVSGTSSISGMRFQNVPFDGGQATGAAVLSTDHTYGGVIGFTDTSSPLVVFNDGVSGDQQFRRYTGSGDLNDAANWTLAVGIGTGFFPTIGYGRSGLFLLSGNGAGRISVRKWTGAGFGTPVALENGNSSTTNLFEDPAGRLHAVHVTDSRRLVHVTSDDGTSWKSSTLTTDPGRTVQDVRVAAAADHSGVAVWSGTVSGSPAEIRAATLGSATTTTAPKRRMAAVEGTYTFTGLPNCLSSGSTLRLNLAFARKLSGVRIRTVDFYFESRRVGRDLTAPYRATVDVGSVKAGAIFDFSVRITGTYGGKTRKRTLNATTKGC